MSFQLQDEHCQPRASAGIASDDLRNPQLQKASVARPASTLSRRQIAALVEKVKGSLALGLAAIAPIMEDVKEGGMAGKTILDKLSIYIPQDKLKQQPVERLMKLGDKRDRSVNYLVVQAIMQYLECEEAV